MRRFALLGLLVLAGCGGGEKSSSPGTVTTAPEPPAEATTSFTAYFLSGEQVTPAYREAPETEAVGRAAVEALLAGPTDPGLTTTVPEGTELLGLEIADGTAVVNLSSQFESGGGSLSMLARLAQLTFTLTQFPAVERVVLELEGERVSAFGGEGVLVDEPLTRDSFPDLMPTILVDRPAIGEPVTSPIQVRGSASVFEATVQIRLTDAAGTVLFEDFTTATEGAPGRGTFALDVPFIASGPATLTAYTISAADGSEQDNVDVPIELVP